MVKNIVPKWIVDNNVYISPFECEIIKTTDGKYVVLSHELQSTLYESENYNELLPYVGQQEENDYECFF